MMTYEEKMERAEMIALMIAAVTVKEKSTELPDRPGYKWDKAFSWGTAENPTPSVVWVEVEDPTAQGTSDNPIPWESGMTVKVNYWYSHEGIKYVCVQSGTPTDITDTAYSEPMTE